MIHEVRPHRRVVDQAGDPELLEIAGRADSGTPEDRRTVDRAGADDHLPGFDEGDVTVVNDDHAGCAPVLDPYSINLGATPNGEVGSRQRRSQVCERGRHPSPFGAVHRQRPDARRRGVVVIGYPGNAHAHARVGKGLLDGEQLVVTPPHDGHRTVLAVHGVIGTEIEIVLEPSKAGKHVIPGPPRIVLCRPAVVVGRRPAKRQCSIDRRTAAEKLPLGIIEFPLPGDAGAHAPIAPRQREAHVRQQICIAVERSRGTRLEHQDAAGRLFAEARAQHRSRRSTADDDVVEPLRFRWSTSLVASLAEFLSRTTIVTRRRRGTGAALLIR